MPILDSDNGLRVGEMQNQWPGWTARGLCMGNSAADNYVIKFPRAQDAVQRANMISALMLINLNFFEKRNNQK